MLKRHGWTADRRVNSLPYLEYFKETEQPISDTVATFLTSFAGIAVYQEPCYEVDIEDCYQKFLVDPFLRLLKASLHRLPRYQEGYIKKPICLVGICDHSDLMAMTADGEFYLMFDNHVAKIGNSVTEVIEHLCNPDVSHLEIISSPSK